MIQNKKGTVILLIVVFGFIIALASFLIWYNKYKPETGEIVYHIGEKQLAVLRAYQEGEKAMFYVDEAAKHSASQAAYDLALGGGFSEEPECGSYLGSFKWSGETGYCYPAELKKEFKERFVRGFLRSLLINPMSIPTDFEIVVNEINKKTHIQGVSQKDIDIPIIIGIEAKPFFVDLDLIWPTDSRQISSCFGWRDLKKGRDFHDGMDVAVSTGTDVKAIGSGTVIKLCNKQVCNVISDKPNCPRTCQGYGNYVIIKHTDTLYSKYSHLSQVLVNENNQVTKGQVIAKSGDTGYSEGPHLDLKIFTSENFAPDVAKNPLCFYSDSFLTKLRSSAPSCKAQFGDPVRFERPAKDCGGITFTPTEDISSELPLEVRDAVNQYDEYIYEEADKKNVDVALIKAIITQESKGDKDAISPTGCKGLGQICQEHKGVDLFDAEQNIIITVGYIRWLLESFKEYSNGMKFAIASYNGGIGLISAAIEKTGQKDPSWEETAAQLTPELLKLFSPYNKWTEKQVEAKINEITGYVEKVTMYYRAWGGIISTSVISGVMGERIGTHYVKPSFNQDINYNLNSFIDIQNIVKNRIVSVCSSYEDIKECVEEQIGELNNQPGYKYSLNCDESHEKIFYDFVENYQDCFESQDDDCVCSFSYDFDGNYNLDGDYKIKLEGVDGETVIALTEPPYNYVEVFENRLIENIEFLFGYKDNKLEKLEGDRRGFNWAYDKEIKLYKSNNQLFFINPKEYSDYEGKRECKLNKKNFKFCVETGERFLVYDEVMDKTDVRPIQIKFAFYFRDTLPPPPLEKVEVIAQEYADKSLVVRWEESSAKDTNRYRIYHSKDDFSLEPMDWIRENVPYIELNTEDQNDEFGEIISWTPECNPQDGYCRFYYEGEKTNAPLADGILYYLDNSERYFYVLRLEEEGTYNVVVTAVDVDGNEIDNENPEQKIKLYDNMHYAEAKDRLAPGLVTPNAFKIGEGADQKIKITWHEPVFDIDGSALDVVEYYAIYYTTNPFFRDTANGMTFLDTTRELFIEKPKNEFDAGTHHFAVVPFDERGNGFKDFVYSDELTI